MPDHVSEAVGASVRRHRVAAGVSQAALADALSLSRTSVTNMEAGRQPLSIAGLYEIARFIGVPVAALLPDDPAGRVARGRRSRDVRSLLDLLDDSEGAEVA